MLGQLEQVAIAAGIEIVYRLNLIDRLKVSKAIQIPMGQKVLLVNLELSRLVYPSEQLMGLISSLTGPATK
jgi:hypothetical protein